MGVDPAEIKIKLAEVVSYAALHVQRHHGVVCARFVDAEAEVLEGLLLRDEAESCVVGVDADNALIAT